MAVAIIAGTGIYELPGLLLQPEVVDTAHGSALVHRGQGEYGELLFLTRHGPRHTTPPHRVNYRANMKALQDLGVERILATYAVGSINQQLPPLSLAALDDFLDFTSGRPSTYFDGDASGVAHAQMGRPYCTSLREQLLRLAPEHGLDLAPSATYVCTNGPRFETAAEIRMFRHLGGDVVGMTGVPEVVLARELGMHFAAVAFSINWAAGIEEKIHVVREGREGILARLLALFQQTLADVALPAGCQCQEAIWITHPPASET